MEAIVGDENSRGRDSTSISRTLVNVKAVVPVRLMDEPKIVDSGKTVGESSY